MKKQEEKIEERSEKKRRETKRNDAKRRETMRRLQGRARRARIRSSLLCPLLQVSPARLSQSSSDEDVLTSAEEMPQNEQREFIVNEEEHDGVNRLSEMLL
jgi:hypothetical protein